MVYYCTTWDTSSHFGTLCIKGSRAKKKFPNTAATEWINTCSNPTTTITTMLEQWRHCNNIVVRCSNVLGYWLGGTAKKFLLEFLCQKSLKTFGGFSETMILVKTNTWNNLWNILYENIFWEMLFDLVNVERKIKINTKPQ